MLWFPPKTRGYWGHDQPNFLNSEMGKVRGVFHIKLHVLVLSWDKDKLQPKPTQTRLNIFSLVWATIWWF